MRSDLETVYIDAKCRIEKSLLRASRSLASFLSVCCSCVFVCVWVCSSIHIAMCFLCVTKTQQASPLHIKYTDCGGVIVFYDCLKWPIVKVNDPNGLINNFILLFSRHNSVDDFVVVAVVVVVGLSHVCGKHILMASNATSNITRAQTTETKSKPNKSI